MNNLIATDEELKILFDTKEKSDAFIAIINRILYQITSRTVHAPFVKLHEVIE
jgi:hypothetical protein